MTTLTWDDISKRRYETGVDRGVLYIPNNGVYDEGHAWNGLTAITETPAGAESNKQYADNQVYVNLLSAETFGGTLEAFTYPDAFAQCDGTSVVYGGIEVGQQARHPFGLCYRTKIGNDTDGEDYGYKLHLLYNALAAPSEKAYATINDTPAPISLSWTLSTTPIEVPGVNPVTGKAFRPTALITIPSTKYTAAQMKALEDILYGTVGQDPRLPLPAEVFGLFAAAVTEVTPTMPTFAANTITIPSVTGVVYYIDGLAVAAGDVPITTDTVVVALPSAGYVFPAIVDNDWLYTFV